MDTYNSWTKKKQKAFKIFSIIGLIAVLILVPIISSGTGSSKETLGESPAETETSSPSLSSNTQSKLEIIREITGIPDTYIFDPASIDSQMLPDDSTGPFRVVVNSTDATACNYAKGLTYEAMEKLYTDDRVKDDIDQFTYTATGYLVTSMSGDDGRDLTNGDGWSGVTNFYKGYFDNGFEVESRAAANGKKTWVLSINNCR
jgi:hypothetical protein